MALARVLAYAIALAVLAGVCAKKTFPFVAGIAYSPIAVGDNPNWQLRDYYVASSQPLWYRDLGAIRQAGANAIRIYGWNNDLDHTLFLDTVHAFDLKVLVSFYLATATETPVDTPAQRDAIIAGFTVQVARYGAHPALLGWTFGNEVNAVWNGFITSLAAQSAKRR